MASNVYLFEATSPEGDSPEKPLVQLMREAEAARSQEVARMIRSLFTNTADFFRRTTTSDDVVANQDETRLAA